MKYNNKNNKIRCIMNSAKKTALAFGLIMALAAPIALEMPGKAFADGIIKLKNSTSTQTIQVATARPTTFKTDVPFNEIIVGDPKIAAVSPLTDQSFYVVGSQAGTTGIALYNENRELIGNLDIEVGPDTEKLNRALKAALKNSEIKASMTDGNVVLSGKAKNSGQAKKAREIASKFDKKAIDSLKVIGSTQVQLEVRFVEAQRRKDKEVGVSLSGKKSNGNRWGATGGLTGSTIGNALISGAMPFGQVLGDLISHGTDVDVLVQALEAKGVVRRLAEPNLVALSGDKASFLAGGEFPIPISGSNGEISVEFKKFGVSLDFLPTVLDNGLINLQIEPEVSAIDPSTSVNFNGLEIPGLVVRRAKTTVELRDGQSFVMAGLLQSNGAYDVRKFPWLGDLPIIGPLFRSASYRKHETDLIIIVTPRLVKPLTPGAKIVTPLDSNAAPNDLDLFVNGKTEINRAKLSQVTQGQEGILQAGHILDF